MDNQESIKEEKPLSQDTLSQNAISKSSISKSYDIDKNVVTDIESLVKLFVPVLVLFIGIAGLFTDKISEEEANQLIFAGGLSTGLSVKK